MTQPTPFNLIMVTAGFEHGGNMTHRFLSDHPNLFTYGFESQIGTDDSRNVLVPRSHPVRYGYPVFEPGTTYEKAFIDIWDEEAKVYCRNPGRSKFKHCGIVMDWDKRRKRFLEHCCHEGLNTGIPRPHRFKPFDRATVIEAYFRSFFDTWENLNRSGAETHYVGYVPGFTPETDRLMSDFPTAHTIHVVRNPWSAYADYLKRPYPQQTLAQYMLAYNVTHTLAYNYARKYAGQYHILRMEDLIANPRATLEPILAKIGLPWSDNCLKPSINGRDLSERLCPWGTVEKPTTEYNLAQADHLCQEFQSEIAVEAALIIKTFGYQDVMRQIGFLPHVIES